MPVVIAQRFDTYLIEYRPGVARLYDARRQRLTPEAHPDSFVSRGYWEPFTGSQDEILGQLTGAEDTSATTAGQQSLPVATSL